MSNLTRFNPFSDIMRAAPFGRLDEFFEDLDRFPMLKSLEAAPRIKMDVVEGENAYTVHAEIPGAKKEDIKVSIEGHMVTISAEVKKVKEHKEGDRVVQSERYYGRESRSFSLGQDIDEDKANAHYDNGVLELTLPVRAGSRAGKTLAIQ
ncbi:Hsp20/alpha crystallin family protein [Lacisediminimonas profundi]|uniref:Hsp20/alpha crystallin family protein n=1 Tax=Lacisediminimonas profundi TaxID=2603856 RepID=UPI00124B2941|nr:Hsp20/alpha crystallin family protein [Lacisediminimonas profundi]